MMPCQIKQMDRAYCRAPEYSQKWKFQLNFFSGCCAGWSFLNRPGKQVAKFSRLDEACASYGAVEAEN
jgi:hypothetical protein